jgi:ADP-ribose pyrophosphatase YjhB (NUDIX family)
LPQSSLTSIGGGYGFLVRGEGDQREIMLVKDSRWPNDLNFVGGAQPKGKLPHDAFVAKVQEKTGAVVESCTYLGSWQRTNANSEGANDTCCFYAGVLSAESPEPEAKESFLNSVHWFSIKDLSQEGCLKTLFSPHFLFLNHYLNELKTLPRHRIEQDFENPDNKIVYNLG